MFALFAIFRKRSGKLLAELAALRKKEFDLVKQAQDHIDATNEDIITLVQEIADAQLVIDEIVGS